MQIQSMHFKARAGQKLADLRLQQNLKMVRSETPGLRVNKAAKYRQDQTAQS